MSGVSLGQGRCIQRTSQAVRVALETHGAQWIPVSVLHDDSEVYDSGHEGDVIVAEWWADKNGFSDVGKRSKP